MPWWKSSRSITRSPASCSSPSSPSFPTAPNSPSRSQRLFPRGRRHHHRQGKPDGGGGGSLDRDGPSSTSTPVSRTASALAEGSPTSPIRVPQPLPTPEGAAAASPSSRRPQIVGGKMGPLMEPAGGNRIMDGSRPAHRNISRSSELGDAAACVSGRNHTIHASKDSNADKGSFRVNLPPRSAPSSILSSPVLSPRRLSNGDFPPACFAPMSPQAWSSSEHPPSDFITRFCQLHPMEQISTSPGSPRQSPKVKSPAIISTNPSPPSSPMHQRLMPSPPSSPLHQKMMPSAPQQLQPKMISENGTAWPDSNGTINAHRLPRPPGSPATMQSPLTTAPFAHQTAPRSDVPSSSMSNQWEKGKVIGSGTFGKVYIATNRRDGSTCAMKEVNLIPDDPKSAECIKQLQQEIRFLSQLKHPNIVQYYGSDIIDDQFYIYLECVFPGSINRYIQERRVITESVVRSFTRHILEGLAYLHSANVMHRDIKGANLLVDASGVVKLADFGMAKHLGEVQGAHSVKGTPYWMAPEVLVASMNKETGYNLSVDIWSLGCTVIEMFTGKHPWSGLESAAAMFKVLNCSPELPQSLSEEGKDFLQRCFRRNPAERPSASELLKHPFVTNSTQHDVNDFAQTFAGLKAPDTSHNGSLNNSTRFRNDQTTKIVHFPNGGASNFHPEPTDTASCRYSPRSTLDVIPGSLKNKSAISGSSADIAFNGAHVGSGRIWPIFPSATSNQKD